MSSVSSITTFLELARQIVLGLKNHRSLLCVLRRLPSRLDP
jgi:hypothetical protein